MAKKWRVVTKSLVGARGESHKDFPTKEEAENYLVELSSRYVYGRTTDIEEIDSDE